MDEITEDVKPVQALPMQEQRKPLLKDLNNFLMCRLCGGYLIEATSLVECFHTYCRSCIVQYLQTSKCCPICEIHVTNKMKPYLSLRPDKIIQRLVYKCVPGLYKNELERRKTYSQSSNSDENKMIECEDPPTDEYYFSPEDLISISLEYIEENKTPSYKTSSSIATVDHSELCSEKTEEVIHKRYFHCPAAVKIEDIHKLIKSKYNLQNNQEVEISYDNVRLPNYLSLMDTAYMFSWNREKPMRLCYQILEPTFIQVPVVISHKISDDFVPSIKNSTYLKHSFSPNVNPAPDSKTQTTFKQNNNETDGNTSKSTFKRKADSTSKVGNGTEKLDDKFDLREPSIKIPRIENNEAAGEAKENREEEIIDTNAPELPPTAVNEDANLQKSVDSTIETTSSTVPDSFADYEQDIEEVEEDDDEGDDDEGRLRISQLSEEETGDNKQEDSLGHLVIDTSDIEKMQEDEYEDRKFKYKRKNKKSKHHHHHHHRKHRHHERKKNATQATILHSPDADSGSTNIMKLKLKLSNHTSSDTKHHKQSKRKHKKTSETFVSSFSSSSSVSSVTISSPEPSSLARADEDSSHSQISECSADSIAETNSSKRETSKSDLLHSPPIPTTKAETVPAVEKEIAEKEKSLMANPKDKLLIMRNFRSKNEVTRSSPVATKAATPLFENETVSELKSSSSKDQLKSPYNKDQVKSPCCKDQLKSPSSKDKLTPIHNFRLKNIAIVRPEEHFDEKDGLNGTKNDDNNNDKPPIIVDEKLEATITETRRPAASSSVLTVSKITAAEMKKEQEKLQLFNGSKEEPPALEITVVPATKGVATVQSPTLSDSSAITIRPSKPIQKPIKPIPAAIPLSQYQKMKSSEQYTSSNSLPSNLPKSLTITPHMVTNTQRSFKLNGDAASKKIEGMKQSVTISLSENDSALDLSGVTKQQVIHQQNKKITASSTPAVRMNVMPTHYSSHLNNKSVNENVVHSVQRLSELHTSSKTNGTPYSVASMSVTSSSLSSPKNIKITTPLPPTILRSQVPIRLNTSRTNNKIHSLPQLNEIKTESLSKPGPNQNVRSIPNLTAILQRKQQQQLVSNFGSVPSEVAMMHRVMSSTCSFSNLKKNSDKCPPAVPINKAYLDRTNLMVTK